MIRAVAEAGVVDPCNASVGAQMVRNLMRIFDVALHAKGDRFNTHQDQEGAHRRKNRTSSALIDAARSGDESLAAEPIDVNEPVIGLVRLAKHWKPRRPGRPIKS